MTVSFTRARRVSRLSLLSIFFAAMAACSPANGCGKSGVAAPADATVASGEPAVITLGAYTTPREAYGKAVLPAFQKLWREKTGAEVEFRESYLGSGAQARAIVSGFEADVAALSLDPDVAQIQTAGLLTHDWRAGEYGGIVSRSVVAIGVRKGNPKNIQTWQDLARADVEVLTPNVRTSGGAMWNVLAIYGAALRGHTGSPAGDSEAATALIGSILRNVKIMDRSGRDSLLTFERGVGDAIITYENELWLGRAGGGDYEYIVPNSTIRIENPVALVDAYADRHGVRDVTKAFVDFLFTPEVQREFAKYGLRSVDPEVDKEVSGQFAPVQDLFTIQDLGGWTAAQETLFATDGVYDKALTKSREGAK